ncbi:MAG: YD repeat-containing protein, partial [Myxococcota bacterium]
TFDRDVTLRIRNDRAFPAGTKIPLGTFDEERYRWEHESVAVVSEDGEWVEGRIAHFSAHDANLDGDGPPDNPNDEDEDEADEDAADEEEEDGDDDENEEESDGEDDEEADADEEEEDEEEEEDDDWEDLDDGGDSYIDFGGGGPPPNTGGPPPEPDPGSAPSNPTSPGSGGGGSVGCPGDQAGSSTPARDALTLEKQLARQAAGADDHIASSISRADGGLTAWAKSPSAKVRGRHDGLNLVYHSHAAYPSVHVARGYHMRRQAHGPPLWSSASYLTLPSWVASEIEFQGSGTGEVYFQTQETHPYWFADRFEGKDGGGNWLSSGLYMAETAVMRGYPTTFVETDTFAWPGRPGNFVGVQSSILRTRNERDVLVGVANLRNSPYGAGWSIGGLPKLLAHDESGSFGLLVNGRVKTLQPAYHIDTLAGDLSDPNGGYTGDSGPAADALLADVGGLVADDGGSVWFTQQDGDRGVVRTVDSSGVISTAAGGQTHYSPADCDWAGESLTPPTAIGDGGFAVDALLLQPRDVAADHNFLFIADRCNFRLRVVNAGGYITTIAGDGGSTAGGDGPVVATSISLSDVGALAVCPSDGPFTTAGEIFMVEGDRIRRISWTTDVALATIETVAFDVTDDPSNPGTSVGPVTDIACDDGGLIYGAGRYVFEIDDQGTRSVVGGNGDNIFLGAVENCHFELDRQASATATLEACQSSNPVYQDKAEGFESGSIADDTGIGDVRGIALADDGSIYVSTVGTWTGGESGFTDNIYRVLKITNDDRILWFGGNGLEGDWYDDRPFKAAQVTAAALTIRRTERTDELLMSTDGHAVRRVRLQGAAGSGDTSSVSEDEQSGGWVREWPSGRTEYYNYDGLLTERESATGRSVLFSYDSAGRLLTKTDSTGGVTTLSYGGNNNLTSVTDAAGRVSDYTIDGAGDLVSFTTPSGATTTYAYDTEHRLTTKTDPRSEVWSYSYGMFGSVDQLNLADGSVRQYMPQSEENLLSDVTGGSGPANLATPLDRPESELIVNGVSRTAQYDRFGFRLNATDANGNEWSFERNRSGQLTKMNGPGNLKTERWYDDLGRLKHEIRTKNSVNTRKKTFDYEGESDLVATYTDEADGTLRQTNYTFDAQGRVLSRTNAEGHTWSYTYDSSGHLQSRTSPEQRSWTYTYDSDGNRLTVTRPDSTVATYTRDASGRLATIT